MSSYVKVRIRATGQVIDMVPDVARAMINGGTAVEVKPSEAPIETGTAEPIAQRAVALAQTKKQRRSA